MEGWSTRYERRITAVDLVTREVSKLPRPGGMTAQDNYEGSTFSTPGVAEIDAPRDLGDGRLLFSASADFSMAGRRPRLHTMPLRGGVLPLGGAAQPKGLTAAFPRPFYGAASPAWALDDRHLAFVLTLCPYVGCEPSIRSVVLVDTRAPEPRLVFVGYGGSPALARAD